jgi:glyceraldehyde 3-phosphate dehydrogenase
MTKRIAINGFGRIGRAIFRAWADQQGNGPLDIVAINDLADPDALLHLLRYDSVHGRFPHDINTTKTTWQCRDRSIHLSQIRDPKACLWKELNVDVVLECTGLFAQRKAAEQHLEAGAKKVLISAPAGKDIDATIVFGVNHTALKSSDTIISNASCTTNCLAPIVSVLAKAMPIKSGMMTTIHAFTSDQRLVDTPHADLRRARSATQSMIPTKTGAAQSIGLVIPELEGKLDGYAMRVPTANVSVVDLTIQTETPISTDALHNLFQNALANDPDLAHVLSLNQDPLVSIDFNHHPASAILDQTQTRIITQGNESMIKLLAWYDNEWGFSNRMLDTAEYWLTKAA